MRDTTLIRNNPVNKLFMEEPSYADVHADLKKMYTPHEQIIQIEKYNLDIYNYSFHSGAHLKLPSIEEYSDKDHAFTALMKYYLVNNSYTNKFIFKMLQIADKDVEENNNFIYSVFKPAHLPAVHKTILLLHGLNEKEWYKYLPWAEALARKTNSAVILFPIAFHMNRAPAEWSNPRLMIHVAAERKKLFPGLSTCSFANTAISHRLQFAPQRLLLSGLQSFLDIVQLIQEIRKGLVPVIDKNTNINIFGYSIGVFLAEILLMTNPHGLFSNSRLFAFCGGAVLDNSYPVSKVILDSEAFKEINRYYNNFLKGHYQGDKTIHLIEKQNGKMLESFKIMLRYNRHLKIRKSIFLKLADRITSLTLKKDRVMPPRSIKKILQGENLVLDFPYAYSHENPFPLIFNISDSVEHSFRTVMDKASSFLM
ncbi:MAG: hypothetical protein GXP33_06175 [Spirochaetes bacterium]|nr:hypothetical protein [Spirochaetota bacterium]